MLVGVYFDYLYVLVSPLIGLPWILKGDCWVGTFVKLGGYQGNPMKVYRSLDQELNQSKVDNPQPQANS